VREVIREAPRLVLLGEPGAGKTTALWRLAADALEKAETDPAAALPLLISLGGWTQEKQSLSEFIRQQVGALGEHLEELLQKQRAFLLLDGLNELPTAYRDAKTRQVRELLKHYPQLPAVVTCREQDYRGELKLDLDTVTIQPLDPSRIQDFIARYLEAWAPGQGQSRSEDLFWQLAGGEAVRGVWAAWRQAGADLILFFTAAEIPRENPNVYAHTTGTQEQIWQERVRDDPRSLIRLAGNPYLLLMLTRIYQVTGQVPANRAPLFDNFVEILLVREKLLWALRKAGFSVCPLGRRC
jgi:predicted NACHT family NTPase